MLIAEDKKNDHLSITIGRHLFTLPMGILHTEEEKKLFRSIDFDVFFFQNQSSSLIRRKQITNNHLKND